jgi:hypothetical protein
MRSLGTSLVRRIVATPTAPARCRAARQHDGHSSLEVDALEVVVPRLGHAQPVTGERQRSVDLRRRPHPHADDGGVAEHDGVLLVVQRNREPGSFLDELPRLECDGLQVAVSATRLEPTRFQVGGDVLGRLAMTRASRVPSLQRIVREKLDVRPPALRRLRGLRHRGAGKRNEHGRDRHRTQQNSRTSATHQHEIIRGPQKRLWRRFMNRYRKNRTAFRS